MRADWKLPAAGTIGTLVSNEELNAACDSAGDERLVVIKFKREGCAACAGCGAVVARPMRAMHAVWYVQSSPEVCARHPPASLSGRLESSRACLRHVERPPGD